MRDNQLTGEIDAVVQTALAASDRAWATNAYIRSLVAPIWEKRLPGIEISDVRIGLAMRRLGYRPWRITKQRGWKLRS